MTPDALPDFFVPERLAARESLLAAGVEAYPYSFETTHTVEELVAGFEALEAAGQVVRSAGRMTSRRVMGKAAFLDLRDGAERIQLYVKRDDVGQETFELIKHALGLGDIIGVRGVPMVTRTGERSIQVNELRVLCAACAEIPYGKTKEDRSWGALADVEIKRTRRYLDWLTDPESFRRFRRRSEIVSWIREYMAREGFIEVDTPTIEPLYGGAEARPFTVDVHALGGQKAYLRIAPELYLKRYIVGGFQKVFTICKNFRNEGIDSTHNPEFTMMEWYEAYTDYNRQMERYEELVCMLVERTKGSLSFEYAGRTLDFARPWRRYSIPDEAERIFGRPFAEVAPDEIGRKLVEEGAIPADKIDATLRETSRGGLLVELVEHVLRKELFQPSFLIDHPEDISPLTKARRGRPGFVERFEPFAGGMELGNAYSELTDPVEQYERLASQRRASKGERDYEDNPLDLDFIQAMACGMPPTGGVGLGVDRIVMLLLGAESIRDAIAFPMRRTAAAQD